MSLAIRPTMSAQYNSVRNAQPKASAKAAAIVNSATSAKASDAEETWTEKWDEYMASLPVAPNKLEEERAAEEYKRMHPQLYRGPRSQTDYMENKDLEEAFYCIEKNAYAMLQTANEAGIVIYRENMLRDPNVSEDDRQTSEIVLPVEQNIYRDDRNDIDRKKSIGSWLDYAVQKSDSYTEQQNETKESDDALQAAKDFLRGILGDVNSDSLGLSGLSNMSTDQAKDALNRAAETLYQKAGQISAAYQKRTGITLEPLPAMLNGETNLIFDINFNREQNGQKPLLEGVHDMMDLKINMKLEEVDPDTLTGAWKKAYQDMNQFYMDVTA